MYVGDMVQYLEKVSNGNLAVNLINHLIIIIVLFLCFSTNRYKHKIIIGSIIVLCLSVVGNALYYGNIFHLITFAILIGFLIPQFMKNIRIKNVPEINIYTIIAFIFIVLGLWYPEFTKVNCILSILYSPLGVVPCPTLLTIGGIMNLYPNSFSKKSWIYIILLMFIYGVIGASSFNVYYDIFLLILVIFSIINLEQN